MENLLALPVVKASIDLLAVCESKKDVILVEYDVLEVLGRLQSSSEVLSNSEERNLIFAKAREELVKQIEDKMQEFVKPKKVDKHIEEVFSNTKLYNKKAYKKPKYRNYLELMEADYE